MNGGILPSSSEFLKQAGFDSEASSSAGVQGGILSNALLPHKALKSNLSREFRTLIVQYCATITSAFELTDIKWSQLAQRLGTREEFLKQSAEEMNREPVGNLWHDVIGERIRRAGSAKLFRDLTWEKLESQALEKLLYLLDAGLIRDAGELLAVANIARKSGGTQPSAPPQGGGNMTQFNIGFGGGVPTGDLPEAGARMTIELSPRAAEALNRAPARRINEDGKRVIDSQMVTADELRNLLTESMQAPVLDAEPESKGEGK